MKSLISNPITTVDQLEPNKGKILILSPTRIITQDEINSFADLTGDHQWIHVDPERCKRESMFQNKNTIAHGVFLASLLSNQVLLSFPNGGYLIDFKVQFKRVVHSDESIYLTISLDDVKEVTDKHMEVVLGLGIYKTKGDKQCVSGQTLLYATRKN
jgi:acyl dehydratase